VVTDSGGSRASRPARRLSSHQTSAQRLNQPCPALVEAHGDGIPHRVNRQGVASVREEWRIVDRWWTDEPVDRRYFDLVLETGQNAVVYRDGETKSWFTQRP
jgi:hypothetical protein